MLQVSSFALAQVAKVRRIPFQMSVENDGSEFRATWSPRMGQKIQVGPEMMDFLDGLNFLAEKIQEGGYILS